MLLFKRVAMIDHCSILLFQMRWLIISNIHLSLVPNGCVNMNSLCYRILKRVIYKDTQAHLITNSGQSAQAVLAIGTDTRHAILYIKSDETIPFSESIFLWNA